MATTWHARPWFINLFCAALGSLALYLLVGMLTEVHDNGYLYLHGGKTSRGYSAPRAIVGVFGVAMAWATTCGIATLIVLVSSRMRLFPACLLLCFALLIIAKMGTIDCDANGAPAGQPCHVQATWSHDKFAVAKTRMAFDTMPPAWGIWCAGGLFLFGMVRAGATLTGWRHARASESWPTVAGDIVKSQVRRPTSYRHRSNWDWAVHYRYTVDGRTYTGTRTHFGDEVSIGVARNIVARYPSPSRTRVHVDPMHPDRSVLIPGMNRQVFAFAWLVPAAWGYAAILWLCA
jgi:hypothetical protein